MRIICVVGPESTGKTTLARELALSLEGVWLPEYAREYLLSPEYGPDDLSMIAEEQWERECSLARAIPRVAVLDTDLVVIKIWWQERYGQVPECIDERLSRQPRRQYLLTAPDLEWEYDPLRESQHDRVRLFQVYKETLGSLGFEYTIICGRGNERLARAIDAVNMCPSSRTSS